MNTQKEAKRQSRVHFSDPIAQVQYVSMSEDDKDARRSHWTTVAADAARFQMRIKELESAISGVFEERHRDRMRDYIKAKSECVCVPE